MTRSLEDLAKFIAPEFSSADVHDFPPDHVAVLLAHHNGEKTLPDQLDSISQQSHKNWSLIVSDDASTDGWLKHMCVFATEYQGRTWMTQGPAKGAAQNFFSLIKTAGPTVPFIALSDQDDFWMPQKLERALKTLRGAKSHKPALYVGRTLICDEVLKPLRLSKRFAAPPSFNNALVQSIGGGNTMVLNRAAIDLVQDTLQHTHSITAHDWWIYQLVSGAGGQVFYDMTPTVLYRQHDRNLIGANDTLSASLYRVGQVLRGRFKDWNTTNLQALNAIQHWLTPEARETLSEFEKSRSDRIFNRLLALRRAQIYRQTKRGMVALWMAALIKKL